MATATITIHLDNDDFDSDKQIEELFRACTRAAIGMLDPFVNTNLDEEFSYSANMEIDLEDS